MPVRSSRSSVLVWPDRRQVDEAVRRWADAVTYRLHANAPNPFNPVTRIRFDLPRPGPARVAVFDLRGRLVQVLADGYHDAGSFTADWFGRDAQGGAVAAGVYVVRLEAPGHLSARKMTLVR